ncbi:copper resistance CopC/CopD family protein [Promicromonospora sp. CA-289599]|uniref:copper resistance CopC/CopD family protein n=1 Tax=Promicromonospora sp. CA-289599 TaxID=3240014 RepID=UPI003D8B5B39
MRRTSRSGTVVIRAAVGVLAALVLALWCAPSATAHTRLESSAPAAGSTSDAPVAEVTLRFTLPVSLLGEGMVIDGPEGAVVADVAAAEDGLVVVATPSEALTAGDYTVTWTAAAQDGHPLEGTFGFIVAGAGAGPSEPAPGDTGTPSAGASPGAGHDMSGMDHDMGHEPSAMDSPVTDAAATVARLGSAVTLWSGLVAAGALAFAAFVLRGRDEADAPVVLRLARWAGVLILGGLAVRVLAGSVFVAHGDLAAAVSPAAIADSLTGTTLREVGLQAAGAVALAVGARRTLRGSWLAVIGAVLVGAGHVLGGHSNTVEPRWLVVSADVAHLAAAATWVGGVVSMGLLLRARHRDGYDLDAALMAARFSVVAALSVTVVGVAGVVLAVGIIDRPEQLWQSTWGLLLLAKVGVVLVVGAIGAYNHFRVVPRLTARRRGVVRHAGRSRVAGSMLLRSAGRETTLMVVIVLLTAWLVAASVQT